MSGELNVNVNYLLGLIKFKGVFYYKKGNV